jgi:hypothetical protein
MSKSELKNECFKRDHSLKKWYNSGGDLIAYCKYIGNTINLSCCMYRINYLKFILEGEICQSQSQSQNRDIFDKMKEYDFNEQSSIDKLLNQYSIICDTYDKIIDFILIFTEFFPSFPADDLINELGYDDIVFNELKLIPRKRKYNNWSKTGSLHDIYNSGTNLIATCTYLNILNDVSIKICLYKDRNCVFFIENETSDDILIHLEKLHTNMYKYTYTYIGIDLNTKDCINNIQFLQKLKLKYHDFPIDDIHSELFHNFLDKYIYQILSSKSDDDE